jgi:hypothetical protein
MKKVSLGNKEMKQYIIRQHAPQEHAFSDFQQGQTFYNKFCIGVV